MNTKRLISLITIIGIQGLFATSLFTLFVEDALAQSQSRNGNQTRTIQVNCTNGDSVQDAIDQTQPWRPLQVDITGVCDEAVEIARDDVTLLGIGANAGIVSSTDSGVYIFGGQRISIEHLTLSGPEAALATDSAVVTLIDVTIEGSNWNGIDAVAGSNIIIEESRVRNNALDGIIIEGGGTLSMVNTVVSGNTRGGIRLNKNSSSIIVDSEISGNLTGSGVDISDNSSAHIKGSTVINGNGRNGIAVIMHSVVRVFSDPVITGNDHNGIFLAGDSGSELVGSVTIGSNANIAVRCEDDESSIFIHDYTNISQAVVCTGF